MLKFFDLSINFINRSIAAIGISAGIVVAFYNVVARYAFDASLTWAAELTTYLFIWSTFFGAAYCFEKEAHISITLLLDKVSSYIAKLLILTAFSVVFIYVSAIAYYGYEYLLLVNELEETSMDLGIPMWQVYLVIPLSFAFSAYIIARKMFTIGKTPHAELSRQDDINKLLKEVEIKTGGML